MSDAVEAELELEYPAITCGDCRFSSALAGKWSIEDGRLVFRADADPQPRRGPDLEGCCESSVAHFTRIRTWDDQVIEGDDLEALRRTARDAYEGTWRAERP